MTKTEIAEKIKNMISENLRIPENMLDDDAELFGGDIGLDSVDSLEIATAPLGPRNDTSGECRGAPVPSCR